MSTDFLSRTAARYPLLRADEEIELGRAVRAWQDHPGGPDLAPPAVQRQGRKAQDRFLLCNLRLAHYIARRFNNRGVPMEDLIQSATEGLLQAVRRFEPANGYRFSSYAVWWAQQACQNAVATQGCALRLPTTVSEALRRVSRATARLRAELNRFPTEEEIEEAANLKPGQLRNLRAAARAADTRSLHDHARQGRGSDLSSPDATWLDFLADDEQHDQKLEQQDLGRTLRHLVETTPTLDPQQREVLRCRYLLPTPMSHVAIASMLNINRDTCRRLERTALATLKARGLRIRAFLPN